MVQERFIQSGAVQLQCFEHGHGPKTLVLVHGYQTSGRIWRLTQEALDPACYHTIALSNRGAGESERGHAEEDYTVEAFARDLWHALSALGVGECVLVGHSMGGATVTQFALEHPQLLQGLVLLNSTPLHGRPLAEDWEAQIRAQFAQSAPQVDFGPRAAAAPADFLRAVAADVARNPVERAVGGRRSMSQIRLRERLHQLSMPVLVVGGDLDTGIGVDNILAEYLALGPERRFLHIYHGVGHSPNVEIAPQLAALLSAFVDRVTSTVGQEVSSSV
jgi:branched-chain amino acid transport system permease protein